jgi:hypothetical protein
MLAEYLDGTVPQLIERARLLKGKVRRDLPRDYEALIRTSHAELDDVIGRLRALQSVASDPRPAVHHAALRRFKRAVADLDILETRAIPALSRVDEEDHHANRLLYRICREIEYPLPPPTVCTHSTGYFYIDPRLNLLFIPPAEGHFLLHLPDLYHELAHPLFAQQDHPVLDCFTARFLEATAAVHDHFAQKREKESSRRGPISFMQDFDIWEHRWTKWLVEFFCDLFAVFALGPAFAWSHLHLFLKIGKDPYEIPSTFRSASHPADDARMRALLMALKQSDFSREANAVASRWHDAMNLANAKAPPDYLFCYPDELIAMAVAKARQGFAQMQCRFATPTTRDPIHGLLNRAWKQFWKQPANYQQWETKEVVDLRASLTP